MVQFGALRDLARRELTECLDRYSGKKVKITINESILWNLGQYFIFHFPASHA